MNSGQRLQWIGMVNSILLARFSGGSSLKTNQFTNYISGSPKNHPKAKPIIKSMKMVPDVAFCLPLSRLCFEVAKDIPYAMYMECSRFRLLKYV